MNSVKPSHFVAFLCLLGLVTACSSSKKFTGFSYDPAGVTNTTDKAITPQHYRTIGNRKGGVWITNEFAGARMSDFYRMGDSLYRVVIQPEIYPVNNSAWYAFKIWSDTVQTVRIQLSYEHGGHRYIPDLSHDGKHWQAIKPEDYAPDTLNGTATLTLNLSPDTLWVSAQELLTQSVFNHWADSLQQKPFVSRDTVGYSHQGRPIQKLTITQANPDKERGVVVVISRLHPPEVTGNMAALTFLDEIASDTELARSFRHHFEVIAYPFANPDGVQNGHWRTNAAGVDLNRDWGPFNQPEPQAIRNDVLAFMQADSLRKMYYGIDFHSTDENIFYPINRDIKTFPDNFTYRWIDALIAKFPDTHFSVEPFDTSSPITKNWIYHTFGADALTYEVNDTADRDTLKAVSRAAAQLFMQQMLEVMEKVQKEN